MSATHIDNIFVNTQIHKETSGKNFSLKGIAKRVEPCKCDILIFARVL